PRHSRFPYTTLFRSDRIFNPVSKQATAQLTWQRDPWTIVATSRYTGSYENDTRGAASRPMRVDDHLVHDLLAAYTFGDGANDLLDGVRVTFGVQNVLDESPPLALNTNILFDPQDRKSTRLNSSHVITS